MTTITKGSTVLRPSGSGIAIIDSTEVALSNDGSDTPSDALMHAADGTGTNISGGTLVLRGGVGTGTGVGGAVAIQITPAGSSGTTEGTPTNALVVNGGTGRVTMAALANGGLVLPVLTTTQINAMSSPVEGQLVYDSTLHKLKVRVAAAWEAVTSA